MDKHITSIFLLILFLSGISYFFAQTTVSDNAYGELLQYSIRIDIQIVRLIVVALTLISSVLVYFSFKENKKIALITSILFGSSAVLNLVFVTSLFQAVVILIGTAGFAVLYLLKGNYRYLSVLFFGFTIFLAYPHFIYALSIPNASLVIPIALIALLLDVEKIIYVISGFVFLYLYPPISIIPLTFAAGSSLQYFLENFKDKKVWFVFLLAFSLYLFSQEISASRIAISFVVAIVFYGIIYLYGFETDKLKNLITFVVILSSISLAIISITQSEIRIPSQDHIFIYQEIEENSAATLFFPNAIEYYSGIKPAVLEKNDLLSKEMKSTMFIASNDDIYYSLQDEPIAFYFLGLTQDSGKVYALFGNNNYLLQVESTQNLDFLDDARIIDTKARVVISEVEFPRLRFLNKNESTNSPLLLINTAEIKDSFIYETLFNSDIVLQSGEVKMFMVKK